MRYLPRDAAPFGEAVWKAIDEAVIGAAKAQLAGRRLLEVAGPFGLGARAMEAREVEGKAEVAFGAARARMSAPETIPIPCIYSTFSLSLREVAAAEERGSLLDLEAATQAAVACARMEDELIFNGSKELGIQGLLTAVRAGKVRLGDWSEVGRPAEDLIKAVTALDAAGFRGPYTAALAPPLYNALYRIYEGGNQTQLAHARQIISAGLVKAPTLASGGVVLAAGRQFASVVLGQDMTAAFVGPAGTSFEFLVLESVCPRITAPEAVCVLQAGGRG